MIFPQILSPEEHLAETRSRRKRAAVKDRSRIWPNNVIPYVIDSDFQGEDCSRYYGFIEYLKRKAGKFP